MIAAMVTVCRVIALGAALAASAPLLAAQPPTAAGSHGQHGAPAAQPPAEHHAHRFDNAAELAKRFDDPARDAWQMPGRVIETLALRPGQAVADIGAGTGYFSARLASSAAAPTVYAVDVEAAMVDHLTARVKREGLTTVTPVLAAADRPNLPAPVDLVLVVDTYHHIPNRVAYFTALKASLRPGGRLAIIDFRKDSPEGPPVQYRLTPEQIGAELAQAGFALAASHDFLPRQHFLIYRVQ